MIDDKGWEKLKAEYVAGGTSYAKLAKKHRLSMSMIQRRARAEGWVKLRDEIRRETDARVSAQIVDQSVDRFMQMYALADRFQAQLAELMDARPITNGRDAHDMGDALLDAVQLIRELYGLPNENQMQGRERLSIERDKLRITQAEHDATYGDNAPVHRWVI